MLDRWCREQPELITFSGQRHALEAMLLLMRGAWAEASTAAELALSRFRAGDYRAVYGAPYQLAELGRLRGAFHSAEESYRRAGESGWEPQPGLALLHLAVGRTQRAQDEIRRSVAGADPFTRRLPAARRRRDRGRRGRCRCGPPCRRRTPRGGPVDAHPDARRDRRRRGGAGAARRGRRVGGARRRARAAVAWAALGAPYERARAGCSRGARSARLGERDAALAEFDAARACSSRSARIPPSPSSPT